MAQQGATLQNYNNDLVRCIEDLREKREEVNRAIASDEEEKAKIQNDLRILTERLSRLNDGLARKISSRNEYDRTIQETEAAYQKILESSQTLLHVLKRESVNLSKKKQVSSERGPWNVPLNLGSRRKGGLEEVTGGMTRTSAHALPQMADVNDATRMHSAHAANPALDALPSALVAGGSAAAGCLVPLLPAARGAACHRAPWSCV
eukprot:CAMPEP_0206033128 /NCGR_PEP_ID=MMETSP1466-20131121/422_1 /ASSEMBLY_ACC=CAM_ASM_001126 /TAXON_ID=44452 /ORGANISM="Pavlova gyrans, Strain CCMP608" /LENGTH=205 /DNA_ID=CAMNT_0053407295 /DNA_START=44 /DNA_END=662 /DNA_ORIENTATION=-